MSTSNISTTRSGGIGIGGLLGVAFIILKLTGVIAWSWLWVLAPFWIPVALVLVILVFVAIFLAIAKAVDNNRAVGNYGRRNGWDN